MTKIILGISAYYHDSAAALISNGIVIAAAQEERFTRKKHDPSFPINAIKYCLKEAKIVTLSEVDRIVFYDNPKLTFKRLLATYIAYAPKSFRHFLHVIPNWIKEKLWMKQCIAKELLAIDNKISKAELKSKIHCTNHHQSHAASAFYPSPFSAAAVLCMDGVGEWATTSAWLGKEQNLDLIWQINFPHSIGLLYSAFTYYAGFKVNSGEYKLMGLAPYGKPNYVDTIYKYLIDVKEDGSFRLNMKYFDFAIGQRMTNQAFHDLFDGPPRKPETKIGQKEMDLAYSIQQVTQDIVIKLAKTIKKQTGADYLCLAGGVALNCVANGKLLKEKVFKDIWIQPAAGDAGGALGAALYSFYQQSNNTVIKNNVAQQYHGSYLGPKYSCKEVELVLQSLGACYHRLSDTQLIETTAEQLNNAKVVGWFQGRMEFGPRALGGRSILGDPRNEAMQSIMNLKIKYRESFRPFAPSVLEEKVSEWFDLDCKSPHMLLVTDIHKDKQLTQQSDENEWGIDLLKTKRSEIPAVTHVDYSARVQTVNQDGNPRYYDLLAAFNKLTNVPVLINTSFNVRGEPIVCTPKDAYRCFMRTEMDCLVIENFILYKPEQANQNKSLEWQKEFELD
ncbi:MAG: carbamoyltransferase [bacterium]